MNSMKDRIKLALKFDVELLQNDLSRLEGGIEWIDHFVKNNYEGEWTVIPLRGPAGAQHPVMMIYSDPTCTKFEDTHFLQSCPYIREVLRLFYCPLQAVRLMKLTPGSVIKEHTDFGLAAEEGNARLHIPIRTNEGVIFNLNGERVFLNEGECWYLRLQDPHSVENHGKTDRVHIVIDAKVNDWLLNLLKAGEG